jgi:hypothetical protein
MLKQAHEFVWSKKLDISNYKQVLQMLLHVLLVAIETADDQFFYDAEAAIANNLRMRNVLNSNKYDALPVYKESTPWWSSFKSFKTIRRVLSIKRL